MFYLTNSPKLKDVQFATKYKQQISTSWKFCSINYLLVIERKLIVSGLKMNQARHSMISQSENELPTILINRLFSLRTKKTQFSCYSFLNVNFFLVLYHNKLNIFGSWTVGRDWTRHLIKQMSKINQINRLIDSCNPNPVPQFSQSGIKISEY